MNLPRPGTREYDEFIKRATEDPRSVEGQVVAQMYDQATQDAASQLRAMLNQMIELAPGRLFRDIGEFHRKFKLAPTEAAEHEVDSELLKFRVKFMFEELLEYCEACSCEMLADESVGLVNGPELTGISVVKHADRIFDAEKAFDALIDLVYVALGTAYLHRFPFDEGWARVHGANMLKERAKDADDPRSTRKSKSDVVKPEGWRPASLKDLL